ncbi:hypothetical protein PVK06_048132 [Gossypium arboreum]|uniref:Uncharacterized protein n=1 Tax=Gossypium arboreum TaxID=29729 RepID=A0ABR0MFF8_GOSAR|nr:hypothetical protein PVK06_048132 [Gossypium arboreum]
MDELRRDVRALHPKSQNMDWLFCSNNSLAPKIAMINFLRDFKVLKDMFEGRRDPRAHLMQYNDYMNALGITDHKVWLTCTSELTSSQRQRRLKERRVAPSRGRIDSLGIENDLAVGKALLTNHCKVVPNRVRARVVTLKKIRQKEHVLSKANPLYNFATHPVETVDNEDGKNGYCNILHEDQVLDKD